MRWVIGDVHGMLLPLQRLLEVIHAEDKSPDILFVGDFVNRGPDSKGVVDHVLTLKNARAVRGNHDDTFDLILSGQCYASQQQQVGVVPTFSHFLEYGLIQTLTSYGVEAAAIDEVKRRPSLPGIAALTSGVSDAHRTFFRNLPAVIEFPDIFIAHAKWDVNTPSGKPDMAGQLAASDKVRHEIIWGRFDDREILRPKPWSKVGFFGHTPVSVYVGMPRVVDFMPVRGDQIVLLDTGCALSPGGRLTAWCVEEKRFVQVGRKGERITESS